MATTRVTLDLDTLALVMAKSAAMLDNTTVDAVVSKTLTRHLIADYAPNVAADLDRDRREAIADAELEAAAARYDDEHPN
jgi:hypothetical protein